MRTGRPVKEETPFKIIIHTNGGRRYASTKVAVVDADGRKQYRHKHWGSIDKDNVFHPNATYFNASPSERGKLIFPEGLVLNLYYSWCGQIGRQISVAIHRCRFYGGRS